MKEVYKIFFRGEVGIKEKKDVTFVTERERMDPAMSSAPAMLDLVPLLLMPISFRLA